jgi:thiopurine S-methyltransferase
VEEKMDAQFWQHRWESREIGFHLSDTNPFLVKHFDAMSLTAGHTVFLPLCGKTRDIAWFLSKGVKVVGAELSRRAVEQLFNELGLVPVMTSKGGIEVFSAADIEIHNGDFFTLTASDLGPVDAVYDRAALIALPREMREPYVAHLMEVTKQAKQLLITLDYDQHLMPGPPFSVTAEEVRQHYEDCYKVSLLGDYPIEGGVKGRCPGNEKVWLLEG